MKKVFIYSVFILISLIQLPNAADALSVIKLTDGSELAGEVLSFKNGIYTIRTQSLGTIQINKAKVSFIRIESTQAKESGTVLKPGAFVNNIDSDIKGQVSAVATQLMGNTDLMKSILDLQNDPDFKSVLNNPEIINAVNSGDINRLISNPDFQKLLDHPTVKDISKKVK